MKKKFFTVLLSLVMILACCVFLSACKEEEPPQDNNEPPQLQYIAIKVGEDTDTTQATYETELQMEAIDFGENTPGIYQTQKIYAIYDSGYKEDITQDVTTTFYGPDNDVLKNPDGTVSNRFLYTPHLAGTYKKVFTYEHFSCQASYVVNKIELKDYFQSSLNFAFEGAGGEWTYAKPNPNNPDVKAYPKFILQLTEHSAYSDITIEDLDAYYVPYDRYNADDYDPDTDDIFYSQNDEIIPGEYMFKAKLRKDSNNFKAGYLKFTHRIRIRPGILNVTAAPEASYYDYQFMPSDKNYYNNPDMVGKKIKLSEMSFDELTTLTDAKTGAPVSGTVKYKNGDLEVDNANVGMQYAVQACDWFGYYTPVNLGADGAETTCALKGITKGSVMMQIDIGMIDDSDKTLRTSTRTYTIEGGPTIAYVSNADADTIDEFVTMKYRGVTLTRYEGDIENITEPSSKYIISEYGTIYHPAAINAGGLYHEYTYELVDPVNYEFYDAVEGYRSQTQTYRVTVEPLDSNLHYTYNDVIISPDGSFEFEMFCHDWYTGRFTAEKASALVASGFINAGDPNQATILLDDVGAEFVPAQQDYPAHYRYFIKGILTGFEDAAIQYDGSYAGYVAITVTGESNPNFTPLTFTDNVLFRSAYISERDESNEPGNEYDPIYLFDNGVFNVYDAIDGETNITANVLPPLLATLWNIQIKEGCLAEGKTLSDYGEWVIYHQDPDTQQRGEKVNMDSDYLFEEANGTYQYFYAVFEISEGNASYCFAPTEIEFYVTKNAPPVSV